MGICTRLAWAIGLLTNSASAMDAQTTHLLEFFQGSARSDLVRQVSHGGYELSGGETVSFDPWYSPALPDLTLLLFTEFSDSFGVAWGVSTGERGPKYRIDPALHLGFSWQMVLAKNAVLSGSLQTLIGGDLHERTCRADYGVLGVSEVNCRLAASVLPPEETLDFLLNREGWKDSRVSVRLDIRF